MSDKSSSSIKVGVDYMRGNNIFPMMLGGMADNTGSIHKSIRGGKPYRDPKFKAKKRKGQLTKKARRANR